jgi:phosphohistidine phosphatase
MPRRLLMIRHAQAAAAPVDRDRPLTVQGVRNAAAIGSWLEGNGYVPDRAVVSPALRTRQTWEQVAEASATGLAPDVDERIYDNTVDAVLSAVTEMPEDVRTLVVVGHNPSIGELSFALDDGEGDPGAQRKLHAGFPAGAVAVFEVAGSFADLAPGGATLAALEVPTA